MSATRSIPVVDGLLAATAKVNGLMLATRNVADVRGLGADIVNPFDPR
jgi:predicted nucleic acid-binding protein